MMHLQLCEKCSNLCTKRTSFIHSFRTPDYSIDTVSELTRQSATGNYEWRTCPRNLCGSWSEIRTCNPRAQVTEPTTVWIVNKRRYVITM